MEDEEGYMALDRRYKRGAAKRPGPLPDAGSGVRSSVPTTGLWWREDTPGGDCLAGGRSGVAQLLGLTPKFYLKVFQKTPTPPNALQKKSEAGGRTEVCGIPSLLRYFCRWNGSTGNPFPGGVPGVGWVPQEGCEPSSVSMSMARKSSFC
ncbi:Killer cell lectin-like receptor subfamily B member 1B allele B isoform X3 [Aix galericulata]|nr:Killer cell lectin-like receptor subfamily B member 1B allele B isoform X3 [Aix galericulata]